MSRPRIHGLSVALLAMAACAAEGPVGPPRVASRSLTSASLPALLGPARYLYVDRLGTFFDEAGTAATLPRPEPALLDGVRVVIDNGVVSAHAVAAEKLAGFRSLPERLGGGFALWSAARSYRARTFLGELEPIVDVGASGGVRPLLRTFLLRTPVGALEVDPASLVARRAAVPGLTEALGLDERRMIRLDLLGRATLTTDGGASFLDVTRERGVAFGTLHESAPPALVLGGASGGAGLRLGLEGALVEARDPALARGPSPDELRLALPSASAFPRSSRALPEDLLAHAVAHGALLRPSSTGCAGTSALCAQSESSRLLVGRAHGLRVIVTATAQAIADADLASFDEKLGGCQPLRLDDPSTARAEVLLACTGDRGAALLSLPEGLTAPRLQRTFPDRGPFIAGPRGRLGVPGRCGAFPPSPDDLGRFALPPPEPPGDDPPSGPRPSSTAPPPDDPSAPDAAAADPPAPGDARICVRVDGDTWIERRVRGVDRARFHRWVPGNGGRATALFLGKSDPAAPPLEVGEGVRVRWIDPADPALQGGALEAPRPLGTTSPRVIDDALWEDDDGAIHGWIRLPAGGEPAPPPAPIAAGTPPRALLVDARRGGRWAGLRIDPSGAIEVLALPSKVTEVVHGGRFALATAIDEGVSRTYESTDGGARWAPVEGPPVGRVEPPSDDDAPFGCSEAGCALGGGAVRLGWGGPPPAPPPSDPAFLPAKSPLFRGPRPLRLGCHFDTLATLVPRRDPSFTPSPRGPLVARPAPPKRPVAPGPKSKPGPKGRAPAAGSSSSPSRVSLHLEAASLPGAWNDSTWTGEAWLPFQPRAALKRITAHARAPLPAPGAVVPVLAAGAGEPWDLLLLLGKERLRIGDGRAFQPFEAPARFTIAADTGDGATLLLDPDKGLLALARGDDQSTILRLVRVPEVGRIRLTLARGPDGKGVSLVGYSTATGEVFVGAIDLGRAEVGPLAALGRLDTLASPSSACGVALPYRFLADVPTALRVHGAGDAVLADREVISAAWIEGNGEVLCLRGVEASLGRGRDGELSARLGPAGGAAIRREAERSLGACAIDAAR